MNPWNCCRTCLSDASLNSVFQNPEQSVQYCEVILMITGLKIQINDSLPQMLCTTCTEILDQVISFRDTCQRSHKTLVERLRQQELFSVKIETNVDAKHNYKDQIDDQSDGQSHIADDSNLDELISPKTKDCTSKMLEFESTVEEILKKRQKIMFENYKPTKRDKKTNVKVNRQCSMKTRENTRPNVDKTFNNYDQMPAQEDIEINQQPEEKLQENQVEEACIQYQCEYCFKMYNNKVSYVNHTKIHTGLKVICEHCGKEFLDKRRLLMHCRSKHGYQKTDKCTYCDYLGISPESVKIHERIHTGEKPYKCKECPASFHRSSSYLQHTARHLPEKTVQCQQCPALFKSVTLMRIHANRHKPRDHKFKCLVCGGNFSSRSSVGRHLRRAHAVARCTQAHLQRVKLNEP